MRKYNKSKSIFFSIYSLSLLLLITSCNNRGNTNPPVDAASDSKTPNGSNTDHLVPDSILQNGKDIRYIIQDKAGNMWFATQGDGVCRYDGKSLTGFTEKDGLRSNYVHTILEDDSGNIWFGTRGGICRYDGKAFANFSPEDAILATDYGRSLDEKTGRLWYGAHIGVNRSDGASYSYLPLLKDEAESTQNDYSLFLVYCALEDKAGNLWIGTANKGVHRYDGKTFTHFTEKGLSRAAMRCIFEDSKGNIWLGNNGAGVCRYDGKSLINFTEEKGLSNTDFLATSRVKDMPGTLARIWSMAEDPDGNLWFATIDSGVWRYDGKSLSNFTTADGLCSNVVWTIYKDNSGTLWFGTGGGGVCKYNGKTFEGFRTGG